MVNSLDIRACFIDCKPHREHETLIVAAEAVSAIRPRLRAHDADRARLLRCDARGSRGTNEMKCLDAVAVAALLLSMPVLEARAACVNARCSDSAAIDSARGTIQTTC